MHTQTQHRLSYEKRAFGLTGSRNEGQRHPADWDEACRGSLRSGEVVQHSATDSSEGESSCGGVTGDRLHPEALGWSASRMTGSCPSQGVRGTSRCSRDDTRSRGTCSQRAADSSTWARATRARLSGSTARGGRVGQQVIGSNYFMMIE